MISGSPPASAQMAESEHASHHPAGGAAAPAAMPAGNVMGAAAPAAAKAADPMAAMMKGMMVPSPGTKMGARSEEHTSELQSLMRTSYAVFCLKKTKIITAHIKTPHTLEINE